ncbi:unnamed protein product [Clonostachys rhizophaga]|uniref:Uncharacterized protein n=1 Tax=Clonostachys rhizophaga TaxID=160324 RepID=A0A9N9VZ87_9HYPO|nr:unnamed protein product [Clonostachys rhizophaga]
MGAFMNYIGLGAVTNPSTSGLTELESIQQLQKGGGYITGEDEVVQGLQRQGDLEDSSGAFLLGMRNAIATLPCRDDGQLPRVTFTTMKDVGRFVAASLDLVKWEENMTMVGETVNLGDLLRHAEEITGFDFKVETRSREADEERLQQLRPDDFLGQLFTQFRLAFGRDAQDEGILEPVVNRLCPDIKSMGIREYMERCWRAAKATQLGGILYGKLPASDPHTTLNFNRLYSESLPNGFQFDCTFAHLASFREFRSIYPWVLLQRYFLIEVVEERAVRLVGKNGNVAGLGEGNNLRK